MKKQSIRIECLGLMLLLSEDGKKTMITDKTRIEEVVSERTTVKALTDGEIVGTTIKVVANHDYHLGKYVNSIMKAAENAGMLVDYIEAAAPVKAATVIDTKKIGKEKLAELESIKGNMIKAIMANDIIGVEKFKNEYSEKQNAYDTWVSQNDPNIAIKALQEVRAGLTTLLSLCLTFVTDWLKGTVNTTFISLEDCKKQYTEASSKLAQFDLDNPNLKTSKTGERADEFSYTPELVKSIRNLYFISGKTPKEIKVALGLPENLSIDIILKYNSNRISEAEMTAQGLSKWGKKEGTKEGQYYYMGDLKCEGVITNEVESLIDKADYSGYTLPNVKDCTPKQVKRAFELNQKNCGYDEKLHIFNPSESTNKDYLSVV